MLTLFINKLNLFNSPEKTQVNSDIVLQAFIDFYCDTAGWYALGHHQPKKFLANIARKDFYTSYSVEQVQLTWAQFQGKYFVITDEPLSDSIPITLVEDYGEDSFFE